MFYVNVPLAAFALTMILGELPKDKIQPVKVDWTGLVLMVVAIGALQMTLDLGESREWFSSKMIQVAALTAIFVGIAFVLRGWSLPHNIIDFGILRDRSFAAANVAVMGFGVSMFGAIAILPLFVQGLLNYPVTEAGLVFIPRGLTAGFSMVITGAVLSKRCDLRVLMGLGLLLTGGGNIMLALLNVNAGFWDLAMPGLVSGLGTGLFFVPLSILAFQNVSAEKQDEASGLYGVTRSLGASIGIAIIGWQMTQRAGYHYATLVSDLTPFNRNVSDWAARLGQTIQSPEAAASIAHEAARQASMLAFQDAFLLTGLAAFAMIPMAFLMRKPDQNQSGTGAAH